MNIYQEALHTFLTSNISKIDFFSKIKSATERREILRWIIHDRKEVNPTIIDILKQGLLDSDWEVRMTTIIGCVRLGAKKLINDIRKVELPKISRTGLNREEQSIMLGIKKVALNLLKGEPIPESINKIPQTQEEYKVYLTRCVAGEEMKHYHDIFMLTTALSEPLYPAIKPKELPKAIEERDGHYFLKKSDIQLSWIPDMYHWVGTSSITYHSIQLINIRNGAFISTLPIQKIGKCTYLEAEEFCKEQSKIEEIPIYLPSNIIWEIAARGHNGRHYPWGLSYEKNMLNQASPWGVKKMVGFGGEWVSTKTKDGKQVIMGNAKTLRCSKMQFSEQTDLYSFRIIIGS